MAFSQKINESRTGAPKSDNSELNPKKSQIKKVPGV